MKSSQVKLFICLLVPFLFSIIPTSILGLEGLTVMQHRTMVLFVLAAFFWILEPIPIYATSVLIIVLELFFMSGSALIWTRGEGENFGELIPYARIMSTFASPIILLFLGGFFLALAAVKYRLDQNLARVLLKPFGNRTSVLLLGIMTITALFSMFMSNTATTAMMLSILLPLLAFFPENDPGKTAFVLGVPVAANIGGIGTPIGTPPNAIALKYLTGEASISFAQWMMFGVPLVIVLILISWALLLLFFKPSKPTLSLTLNGKFMKSPQALLVYVVFITTVLLWLTDFLHGMNSYTVALFPVAVFLATGVINKEDLKKINWDVLWLVSGGIALGLAIEETGLASRIVKEIPFESLPPLVILSSAMFLGMLMANFMSNTATANLIIPILAVVGSTVSVLDNWGGAGFLILSTGLSISMGMSLPISTPPNALAHATGLIQTNQMAKIGVLMGVMGICVIALILGLAKTFGIF